MSLKAAWKLSIPQLLRVLGEKLDAECSKVREISLPLAIENLETRAHDILRFIRSLRNTSLPVNRLPPEIISYVARCVLRENHVDTRLIVPLTHVCRYWRDSIISSPDNWTLIFNGRKGLAASSLERAKAAPLAIYLNMNTLKRDPEFLDLLLPHTQNITSLCCIDFLTIEELTQALPNFPKSTPNLQSLDLIKSGHTDWTQTIDPFDFSAHALRKLSLSDIPLYPSFLSLRSLTKLSLLDYGFNLHLDTLLNFLEENHSLESATLTIGFAEPSLCRSSRQTPVGNRLQHLLITYTDAMSARALISGIALRRGAALKIHCHDRTARLANVLSVVSATQLLNLSSPTFMGYRSWPRSIRLHGPDGSFSYESTSKQGDPFEELPLLPLNNIRKLRINCLGSWIPTKFRLSDFPSLQVLAIDGGTSVSLRSTVLPDHTSSPLLKTIAILNCSVTEDFVAKLVQLASDRGNNNSTSLHRVVIVDSKGRLPGVASVERLRKCVPVVEVMQGNELPKGLW